MESLPLATTSAPHSQRSDSRSKSQLIREWIAKLALNAGQGLDASTFGVYQALWEEGFEDLSYEVLEAAFKKALREGKFWPVKVRRHPPAHRFRTPGCYAASRGTGMAEHT